LVKVVWTVEALERLQEIQAFISLNHPGRAEKFVESLINRGNSLGENPRRGRIVPEFSDPRIRELIIGNYRLVFRLANGRTEIITVFEGHRKIRL